MSYVPNKITAISFEPKSTLEVTLSFFKLHALLSKIKPRMFAMRLQSSLRDECVQCMARGD